MEQMREYETIYILRPDLTDEAVNKVNERLTHILEQQGAKVIKCSNWGKKNTAYEIKKYSTGVYVQMGFLSTADNICEFERNLRMMESVLRYQTIKYAEDVDVEKRLAEQKEKVATSVSTKVIAEGEKNTEKTKESKEE